jgi:hypothetical protein
MLSDIATALAKAQSEMKNATLNKTNPHFRSKYADLAGIRDAITPALTKHGIAVTQLIEIYGEMTVVATKLIHTSGQMIESRFPIMADPTKPQAIGSAITYARRYSLSAICGIAADEDDDGNAAQEAAPAKSAHLSKSSARPVYEKLQAAIDKAASSDDLKIWVKDAKAEIATLPPDWQDVLRNRFEDKINSLKKEKVTND